MANLNYSRLLWLVGGAALVAACTSAPVDEVSVSPASTVSPSAIGGHGAHGAARYIVKFKSPAARAAVQAAGGSIALELPAHDAFAAYIPAAAVAGLSHNPNVEYIEEDVLRAPSGETVPYGVDMVQARQVWDQDSDGLVDPGANAGAVKVCIIDSGLDVSHPDFAGVAASGTDDPGTGSWSFDSCHHGTHVAGTIAAANNATGVVGVAPGASLHIVKVFGGDTADAGCDWAYSSSLVAALDKCKAAGAKIVSMSLGGTMKSRTEDSAFKKAASEGILSIAAAGNDGNTRNSYPASYGSVVSVAAIDANRQIASFSQQNSQVELSGPGVHVLSSVPVGTGRTASVTVGGAGYASEGMDGSPLSTANGPLVDCGLGDSVCSAAAGGKICLIARGNISFEDKINNCSAGGGAGAIIFNNLPGIFGGYAGTTTTIPSVGISQEDGAVLLAGAIGAAASLSVSASDHAYYDGTSMATPHVSAVAALVWGAHPEWTAAEVREALGATAEDLGAAGRDNAFGYGLVRAAAAIAYTGGGGSGGGGGGGGTCKAAGASCSSGSECCSNKCNKRFGCQ